MPRDKSAAGSTAADSVLADWQGDALQTTAELKALQLKARISELQAQLSSLDA